MTIAVILGLLSFGLGWFLTRWLVQRLTPKLCETIGDIPEESPPKPPPAPWTKEEIAEERRIADEFIEEALKRKQ